MPGRKKVYTMAGNLDTNMRYAVYASADKFLKKKHALKVWKTLKEFGCQVYPVAPGLQGLKGSKVYSDLAELKGKVDVVIPCLLPEHISDIVKKTFEAGAKYLWFQEKNWTPEFQEQCEENGIEVVRGCVLKHKTYKKPFAFFNPCYWHGWKEPKVPSKY